MTRDNKIQLLHFITRTGMYITTQDKGNVVSFIHGFEVGATTRDFTNTLERFVTDTFKIEPLATGWPGQIERLSKKLQQSWLQTFKQVSLQVIAGTNRDDLKEALDKTVKSKIQGLIERIEATGNPWFNEGWTEEWKSLCAVDFEWFKQCWTSEELGVVQAIDKAVSSKKVFLDEDSKLPTPEIISLKEQFKCLT